MRKHLHAGVSTALLAVLVAGFDVAPATAQFVCAGNTSATADGAGANASGSSNSGNVACGPNANASGGGGGATPAANTATGSQANASGEGAQNTATGNQANASGDNGENAAVGFRSNASGRLSQNTAIGPGADASGDRSQNVAIGFNARASSGGSGAGQNTAVGTFSEAGNGGAAFGFGAKANFSNSAAFGHGATATRDNQQVFGTQSSTYTMAGIDTAASRSAQTGPLKVVSSDAAGNLAARSAAELGLASAGDLAAINARLGDLSTELRRGMAASAALAPVIMPSAPGRTTASVSSGFYRGQVGLGLGVAHRLNLPTPVVVHGSYSNGGGSEHVGRLGVAFEF